MHLIIYSQSLYIIMHLLLAKHHIDNEPQKSIQNYIICQIVFTTKRCCHILQHCIPIFVIVLMRASGATESLARTFTITIYGVIFFYLLRALGKLLSFSRLGKILTFWEKQEHYFDGKFYEEHNGAIRFQLLTTVSKIIAF